jgi:hypothetical protein
MSAPTAQENLPREPMQHEFDSGQNQIIGDLVAAMRWIGLPLIVLGVFYGLTAVMSLIQAQVIRRPELWLSVVFVALATLFLIFLGIWTRRAADSFGQITTSSGRDIDHLMGGLDNLRKAYSLLSAVVKLYVALIIASLVAMLIITIAGAFRS